MKKILFVSVLLLFVFDLNAKIIYVDPVQNSKYVSTQNSIIIGFDEIIKSTDINSLLTVTGSLSGVHKGEVILTDKSKKIIFKPFLPFTINETVEVKLNNLKTAFTSNNSLKYSFSIQGAKPDPNQIQNLSIEPEYTLYRNIPYAGNFAVLPQPVVTISNNPSPGRILLASINNSVYPSTIMIANNDASLFYSQDLNLTPLQTTGVDFTKQKNGSMTYFIYGKYYSLDSLYNRIDSFYCGNGYSTDAHELRILNNENALVMSYDSQHVDMSTVYPGGNPNAVVIGLIIQEIDKNKNVVFQWRSWDHFSILDAQSVSFTSPVVDYVHGNAIEYDKDGNLMISSRHMNEITKISRSTGDIIWRLGGINNQFTIVNDSIPFHYQHDIRRIENGNITMFDNGNYRTPQISRAIEYQLDEVNKVATLVWEYRHTPAIYSGFMGSVQRLKSGNTIIGWGGSNNYTATEVTPAGNISLEMNLPVGIWSYRVFKDEGNVTLNVKLAIEGMYNTAADKLNINDTVTIFVRNSISPYTIVDSQKTTVDSVSMNANCRLNNTITGTYFISVKHRNGLETWSKAGGEAFSAYGVYNYDFRTSAAMAFGNNLKQTGSKYCIYSGDVNQDQTIDGSDMSQVENDVAVSISGYVSTDVNGDDFVDASDQSIVENNATLGVSAVIP